MPKKILAALLVSLILATFSNGQTSERLSAVSGDLWGICLIAGEVSGDSMAFHYSGSRNTLEIKLPERPIPDQTPWLMAAKYGDFLELLQSNAIPQPYYILPLGYLPVYAFDSVQLFENGDHIATNTNQLTGVRLDEHTTLAKPDGQYPTFGKHYNLAYAADGTISRISMSDPEVTLAELSYIKENGLLTAIARTEDPAFNQYGIEGYDSTLYTYNAYGELTHAYTTYNTPDEIFEIQSEFMWDDDRIISIDRKTYKRPNTFPFISSDLQYTYAENGDLLTEILITRNYNRILNFSIMSTSRTEVFYHGDELIDSILVYKNNSPEPWRTLFTYENDQITFLTYRVSDATTLPEYDLMYDLDYDAEGHLTELYRYNLSDIGASCIYYGYSYTDAGNILSYSEAFISNATTGEPDEDTNASPAEDPTTNCRFYYTEYPESAAINDDDLVINCYSNENSGQLMIDVFSTLETDVADIHVYAINGQQMSGAHSTFLNPATYSIPCSLWSSGLYLVDVAVAGQHARQKVLIK